MSEIKIKIPDAVAFIIDRMNSTGFCAHVVGGAVRDSILGRELGDFDINTDALPEQTKAIFPEYKTIDTGIKHGTVSLVIDSVPYEITTYRIDGEYKDNRHPESVLFTDKLAEDLKRRDFTINAMCYSPNTGLIDLFGGIDDANAKIIRAVGDPRVRFSEDALRILRALRFSSVLDFDIESDTAEAAREKRNLLGDVSRERIYTEFKKLVMGNRPASVLTAYSEIFEVALDGFKIVNMPTDNVIGSFEYLTRLAAIFVLNSNTPDVDAERVLNSLKTDKFTRIATVAAILAYNKADFSTDNAILHLLFEYGSDTVSLALSIGRLLGKFGESEVSRYSELMKKKPVYRISELDVGGNDILALGIKGERVGDTLKELTLAVIDGKCENKRDSLIGYIENK